MSAQLEPWVLDRLRDIGLQHPSPQDPLHVALVNTVLRLGQGASGGVLLTAMRWDINWAQREAGRVYAQRKVDYEHAHASAVVKSIASATAKGEKLSVALADRMADVECYGSKLEALVAEKQEQSLRKMLDTIETQIDVWRTGRADERAADRAHSQGYSGGA